MKPQVDDGDDDLDDLDDVLDQFTSPPRKQPNTSDTPVSIPAATSPTNHLPPAPPPPTAAATTSFLQSGSASSSGSDPVPQGEIPETDESTAKLAEDFVTELTKGMESLMREIGGDAGLPGFAAGEKTEEQEREFRAAWEAMLIQGMGQGGISELDTSSGSTKDNEMGKGEGNVAGKEGFQQSIRQTMDKLKESESMLKADANSTNADANAMEAFLAQLGDGAGGESEEELNRLLESMMSQLMSKDVLYEPLKDLQDKLPAYLKEHQSTLSSSDKSRYTSQLDCASKLVKTFDEPTYSDEDAETTAKIVALMTEMQSLGSPPVEILGPMPPGITTGPDGMPHIPEGCVVM